VRWFTVTYAAPAHEEDYVGDPPHEEDDELEEPAPM
jgi:hypothetical protein